MENIAKLDSKINKKNSKGMTGMQNSVYFVLVKVHTYKKICFENRSDNLQ